MTKTRDNADYPNREFLDLDSGAGDQTVESTGKTTFNGLVEAGKGVKVSGSGGVTGPVDIENGIFYASAQENLILASGSASRLFISKQGNVGISDFGATSATVSIRGEAVSADPNTYYSLLIDNFIPVSGAGAVTTKTVFGASIRQKTTGAIPEATIYNVFSGVNKDAGQCKIFQAYHAENTVTDAGTEFNAGFYSSVNPGTGSNYNFYAEGAAPNYFAGLTEHANGLNVRGGTSENNISGSPNDLLFGGNSAISAAFTTNPGNRNYVATFGSSSTHLQKTGNLTVGKFTYQQGGHVGQKLDIVQSEVVANTGADEVKFFSTVLGPTQTGAVYGYWSSIDSSNSTTNDVYNFYANGNAPNYFAGITEHASGVKVTGGNDASVECGLFGNSNMLRVTSNNSRQLTFLDNICVRHYPDAESSVGFQILGEFTESKTSLTGISSYLKSSTSAIPTITHYTATQEAAVSCGTSKGFEAAGTLGLATTAAYGFYSELSNVGVNNYNFYAAGDAPNFLKGNTYIGGNTTRNTRELWESTLTEEQKEQLSAGTLAIPANVSTPGDGSFVRQWWYDQQDAETQALIDSGETEYPAPYAAANFVDTFNIDATAGLKLGSNSTIDSKGYVNFSDTRYNVGLPKIGFNSNADDSLATYTAGVLRNYIDANGTTNVVIDGRTGDIQGFKTIGTVSATSNAYTGFWSQPTSPVGASADNNISYVTHFRASTGNSFVDKFESGDSRHAGFTAGSGISGALLNAGFYGELESGNPNSYNFYAAGDAPNYFAGAVTGPNWTINADGTSNIKVSDVLTVKDFGAVGDGATNDSVAINAALDWWSSTAGRHLHFPEGAYKYEGDDGSKTIDCEWRYGNKLTMDGYIVAGTEDKKSFTFRRLSDGYIQMFVWGGGLEGTFNLADPPTGSTFLQVEAAHNTKFHIRSIGYAGRVLRMTHLNGPNQDDSNPSNRCIFNETYIVGKGRLEGRIGQQFYCDAGTNGLKGAFGMLTWIGDGYEYGSVFDTVKDITIPTIEAGSFNAVKAGAGLEFRGVMNVQCGYIYLGESWGQSSNSIALGQPGPNGQPGKQYQDCMLSGTVPDYKKVLFYIGGEGAGRSRNIFIDKYNALMGGVGLNIEKTYSIDTGIIINQMNTAGCGVGLNLNDIDGDVYIGALSGSDNGMLVNKYGATSDHTPLIDINVVKMGKILFNGQNKDTNGNPVANDPVKPAILSQYHHGLFKITGNFEDKWEGIKENQPLIEITDDGDEYYLISNARFSTVKADGSVATGSNAIKIFNPFNAANSSNNVRVTDCIFMPGTEPMGGHSPSYARGCVGFNDIA